MSITTYAFNHLVSWESNQAPAKGTTLSQWVAYAGWDAQTTAKGEAN